MIRSGTPMATASATLLSEYKAVSTSAEEICVVRISTALVYPTADIVARRGHGTHIFSSSDDEVLEPVFDVYETFLVYTRDVARIEPPITIYCFSCGICSAQLRPPFPDNGRSTGRVDCQGLTGPKPHLDPRSSTSSPVALGRARGPSGRQRLIDASSGQRCGCRTPARAVHCGTCS
jgi:hypothetical protein